jgi:hypothetical protein
MFRVAVAAAIVLAASLAHAQIFNVQPLLEKQTQPGFAGSVEGALDWRSGNTTLTLFTGSAHAQWQRGRHLVFATLHGELGLSRGDEVLSRDLEHLRYRVRLSSQLAAEAFVQHDADAFRRLAVRAIGGAGLRLAVVNGRHVTLAVAAAYMLEYERLAAGMFPDSDARTLDQRLSTYAVVAVSARWLTVAHTVYAQPRFDDFSDVRMLGDSSLSLTVTKHLAVRFSVTLTLDTRPPAGVLPVDSDVKSTLVGSF